MRRALVALAIVGVVAYTATPAAACSIAQPPLSIYPSVGGEGTQIGANGYCNGDATVTLGWPARLAQRPIVDAVRIQGNSGAFSVTLTNHYVSPVTPYIADMEVSLRCAGQEVSRVPFAASDHVEYARTRLFTVPATAGPIHLRGFDEQGNINYPHNSYVGTNGAGGSVAVLDTPANGSDVLVVGSGPGTEASFTLVGAFAGANAYPGFRGGVNVAAGDVDGDGDRDIITAAGPGGGPHVKVWKQVPGNPNVPACGPLYDASAGWYAYDVAFGGGVSVAAADLDGDGKAEIITGALAGGGPHVRVFDEAGHLKSEFMAYDPNFHGGVNVAAADLVGDTKAEIVTGAGPGGGPHVRVFDAATKQGVSGFYAYAPDWTGGVFVAAGRLDPAAGKAKIVTGAGPGGGPHVRVFDTTGGVWGGFFAYENWSAGVRVAAAA